MRCPHCQERVTKSEGDAVIVTTRYVRIDESGKHEFSCRNCRGMIAFPAPPRRLGVRKGEQSDNNRNG